MLRDGELFSLLPERLVFRVEAVGGQESTHRYLERSRERRRRLLSRSSLKLRSKAEEEPAERSCSSCCRSRSVSVSSCRSSRSSEDEQLPASSEQHGDTSASDGQEREEPDGGSRQVSPPPTEL